jgi:fructose-1,6-bisphosphatase
MQTPLDPKKIKTVFNRGTVTRIYELSPEDSKITLESYLAAGRPLHTDQSLLYGSDALDYIRRNGNQSDVESS